MQGMFMALGLMAAGGGVPVAGGDCPELLDVEVRRLAGDETVRLCDAYRGNVTLIVNTASKCGFTPQYEGLESLYREYRDRGLVVLGFPSNDFANQEPGNEQEIASFCRLTYAVDFPMFEKVHVKKGRAAPIIERLVAAGAGYPKWNFYKYLIGRDGRLVKYYSSFTGPRSARLVRAIESAL
jgi:glutathione peroxidase